MKRIVCLCTLPSSFQDRLSAYLMDAYDDLRKFNIENAIKGIFIVYKNTVLLVLEGEPQSVARATYKTRSDNLFKTFSIIVNCDIDAYYFNRWSIRLVKPESESQQLFLDKLKKELEKDFAFESPKDRKLYEDIYIAERKASVTILNTSQNASQNQKIPDLGTRLESSDLSGYAVSLSLWPKPTQAKLTPQAIKTCSLISNRFVPYRTIVEKQIWANESELIEFINALYRHGILSLKVHQNTESNPSQNQPSNIQPQESDRFSQLIKKFITTPRSKAN